MLAAEQEHRAALGCQVGRYSFAEDSGRASHDGYLSFDVEQIGHFHVSFSGLTGHIPFAKIKNDVNYCYICVSSFAIAGLASVTVVILFLLITNPTSES